MGKNFVSAPQGAERAELPQGAGRPERAERPEQSAPVQIPSAPAVPTAPEAPAVSVGGETPAPGRITIERNGKTYTIDGASGGNGSELGSSTSFPFPPDIPPGVQSIATTAIVGFCMMIAAFPVFGLLKALVNRRSSTQLALPSHDTTDRLQRIEAAVDAMSVEVERISEGQRFVTKVLSERSSAPG